MAICSRLHTWTSVFIVLFSVISMVSSSGFFEMQILEIANTNSHLLSGYCCGLPATKQRLQTTGCPACATAFRLCLKEYQGTTSSSSGQQQLMKSQKQQGSSSAAEALLLADEPQTAASSAMYGCAFGNASTPTLGGSSFVLSDSEVGRVTLPFTFRWTVSHYFRGDKLNRANWGLERCSSPGFWAAK